MAYNVADLIRKRAVGVRSIAQRNNAGLLVQNYVHNSIVVRRGQFNNVFEQSSFDSAGKFCRAEKHIQAVNRLPTEWICLNIVNLRWTQLNRSSSSVDVVTRNDLIISPWASSGRTGRALTTTCTRICPNGGDKLGDIAAFRLYYSETDMDI